MKNWLINNKIYFETTAVLLISVMAIIVSINSNNISKASKEISYRNSLPIFEIISTNSTSNSDTYLDRKVSIYNYGGSCRNLTTETITFYDIVGQDTLGNIFNVQIPIKNYFFANSAGERKQNIVKELIDVNSKKSIENLHLLIESALKKDMNIENMAILVSFLKMDYLDLLNNQVQEFHNITFYESRWISNFKGNLLFDSYKNGISNDIYIDIDNLNPEQIRKVIKQITPHNKM